MKNEQKLYELVSYLKAREDAKRKEGFSVIAGADEAGRGPLCGPVVAACVVLPQESCILGVNDSKKIPEKKREELYDVITKDAVDFSLGIVEADVIDEINILNAARLAFKKAVDGLKLTPDFLFTDAITGLDIDIQYESVIKGDANIYSVAAASIVAKVTRDRILKGYDLLYPEYGFAKHKGYATKEHRDAIIKYGALPIHRRSFLRNFPDSIYE